MIGYICSKDTDHLHKEESKGEFTILEKIGDNNYIVSVAETNTKCHALFNPFSNSWFVDDVYRIVK